MADWKWNCDSYDRWQEKIMPDRWLLCFRKREEDHTLPDAWVSVIESEWAPCVDYVHKAVEEHRLMVCGPLELHCIMEEMRRKYSP